MTAAGEIKASSIKRRAWPEIACPRRKAGRPRMKWNENKELKLELLQLYSALNCIIF